MLADAEKEDLAHGVPIRAASRALEVLEAINRLGSPTIMEIKEEIQLPYPTIYRIIMTLVHEEWIEQEPARKRYRPTQRVWSLVSGFQTQDLLVACARNPLVELTNEVLWPATLTARVGDRMMVKDSTHSLTSQTFAVYYPGYTLPLLDSAAGKAHLAFCSENERRIILDSAKAKVDEETELPLQIVNESGYLESIRTDGFATQARLRHNDSPGRTSAIAVPVFVAGKLEACLGLVYFSLAMSEEEAITQYVTRLKETAERIGAAAAA